MTGSLSPCAQGPRSPTSSLSKFHPTALFLGQGSLGQQPLVSEALRGEGAVLLDGAGTAVMAGVHPLADLAPRDVVAKQMSRVMAAEGTDHLYLDARPLGRALLEERFPTIVARCRAAGVDPVTAPIPVAPAAHYASGGVLTDLAGRTTVPGLFACGEVACTGVHGANRLASNSLLEGLVFAARIADALAADLPPLVQPERAGAPERDLVDPAARGELQRAMTDGVGVLRSRVSLDAAAKVLDTLPLGGQASPDAWETTGLLTVATALVTAATLREEDPRSPLARGLPARRAALARPGSSAGSTRPVRSSRAGRRCRRTEPTMRDEIAEKLLLADLDPVDVGRLVHDAIAEDLGGGIDATSVATVPFDLFGLAEFRSREAGVIAGVPVALAVIDEVTDGAYDVLSAADDAIVVVPGDTVLGVEALVRPLLTGERVALNLLCHLSGIATMTAQWVDALEGTGARVRDTRKTTPGLRALEKYAVRCGGGMNHRMALSDAALVKDNHVLAAGGVKQAFALVRETFPELPVEIECDTFDQVLEAVDAGADLILLDNMTLEQMHTCVEVCRPAGVRTEASGGLTLTGARAVGLAGVDYLAVGALTHSAPVLDLGVDLAPLAAV